MDPELGARFVRRQEAGIAALAGRDTAASRGLGIAAVHDSGIAVEEDSDMAVRRGSDKAAVHGTDIAGAVDFDIAADARWAAGPTGAYFVASGQSNAAGARDAGYSGAAVKAGRQADRERPLPQRLHTPHATCLDSLCSLPHS
jgi:hypothetical protein